MTRPCTMARTLIRRPSSRTALKHSYLAIFHFNQSHLPSPSSRKSFSTCLATSYSAPGGGPYTGSYDPGEPTKGPLSTASNLGASRLTPRRLKEYLDNYVVGQERSKKMMAVAIYNHYQRTQEMYRYEEEEKERIAKALRRKYDSVERHPTEDEFPGQIPTVDMSRGKAVDITHVPSYSQQRLGDLPLEEASAPIIEKSNIMMIGPTGVGKTLMAKTLARILEVPFSVSDCTPFTQSGYIGEDAEVCVHRLLAAADFDVAAAEHGIIYLDEVDKLAASRMSHGRDVSGEGVQQALLKIIEGTTISITAKAESKGKGNSTPFTGGAFGGAAGASMAGGGQKTETFQVKTDNILFIFSGAFVGLDKLILNRVSRGSMGFGAAIRSKPDTNAPSSRNKHDLDPALFRKVLPFYNSSPSTESSSSQPDIDYNVLDLVTPADYQTYGLIPEFTGRIPITTALSTLSLTDLTRILTEPTNSLIAQYTALFSTYGVTLHFTPSSLHAIATIADEMATGARGLRSVLERVLAQAMYEVPGSSVKFVLVNRKAVRGEGEIGYFGRGQGGRFKEEVEREEAEWEVEERKRRGEKEEGETVGTFEEYREVAVSGL